MWTCIFRIFCIIRLGTCSGDDFFMEEKMVRRGRSLRQIGDSGPLYVQHALITMAKRGVVRDPGGPA